MSVGKAIAKRRRIDSPLSGVRMFYLVAFPFAIRKSLAIFSLSALSWNKEIKHDWLPLRRGTRFWILPIRKIGLGIALKLTWVPGGSFLQRSNASFVSSRWCLQYIQLLVSTIKSVLPPLDPIYFFSTEGRTAHSQSFFSKVFSHEFCLKIFDLKSQTFKNTKGGYSRATENAASRFSLQRPCMSLFLPLQAKYIPLDYLCLGFKVTWSNADVVGAVKTYKCARLWDALVKV